MNESGWHLLKHEDGTVFGPVTFQQIREWALEAQISPLDRLSSDGIHWQKAPTIADLEMDWLVAVAPDQFYGPTTIGALTEFMRTGEINGDTTVINCCTGVQCRIRDVKEVQTLDALTGSAFSPSRTSIRTHLQQRLRTLELTVLELRRQLEQAEERYRKLEAKHQEITGFRP